jgi:hypothetical protein
MSLLVEDWSAWLLPGIVESATVLRGHPLITHKARKEASAQQRVKNPFLAGCVGWADTRIGHREDVVRFHGPADQGCRYVATAIGGSRRHDRESMFEYIGSSDL